MYYSNNLKISIAYLDTIMETTIFIMVLIIIGLILFISSRIKELKLQLELEKITERNIYIDELERKNIELRKFRHDYKNLLLSLSASLSSKENKNNSIQQLLNYADKSVDSSISIENRNLYQINNDFIRGIIITKLIYAKGMKIHTNFEIDGNADLLNINSIEITRILGILFDNAIEASLETKKPELNFALVSFDGYIEFIIKNNLNLNTPIEFKDFEKLGYTTKENHSGLGLASVRDILDRNNNIIMQTKLDDGYYSSILTVMEGK